ncbi:M6 family metalloprotease domain-containing protein [Actinoplanes sp. NPDC026623]|uniref:M6 family metalloprotease domain-containing protein n=1 Tax=Actinoplanes sp. NPDC026623 TaxID=3155610 RepID=UPI0033D961E7
MAPDPELNERIKDAFRRMLDSADASIADRVRLAVEPHRPGFNDGTIMPPEAFPAGTSTATIARAASDRAPLRGTVRVVVVLVEFPDRPLSPDATVEHFRELFFSTGRKIPTGSVREYYSEVTHDLVTIDGEVVGPYTLPQNLSTYAHNSSGVGDETPNARTMARDALLAADADVDFDPYDNDGNGYVDAFIVVHAGPGAESTGQNGDIWSHKWTLDGGVKSVDRTKVYGYLTIPEDARIGVCAHELGHLLFGWPDLYDTDQSSEGIGNWCLMAAGSWNGRGDTPAHPNGFLKVDQGWANRTDQTANGTVVLPDVKANHEVLRLWHDGVANTEYFLLENRQRTGFDAALPGDGLLIWHIDETVDNNRDENHYRVALMQADGMRNLEHNANRGDAGDPFPGSNNNLSFTASTNPASTSYAGVDVGVAVTEIGASSATVTANIRVR